MRSQTTITAVRSLLFGMLTLIGTAAWAQSEAVADATQPEVPRYFVWTGFCSRSLQVTSSHFDVQSALTAVYRTKEKEDVFITEGKDVGHALAVLTHRRGTVDNPKLECTVYRRTCRSLTWRAISPEGKTDMKSATELLTDAAATPVYRVRS